MLSLTFARRLTSLAHPLPRVSKSSQIVPNNPKYKRLMELQTHFCKNDGTIVWQKRPNDLILYRIIVGLVSTGFVLTIYDIYRLATPPTND